jgi:hypothetical protein
MKNANKNKQVPTGFGGPSFTKRTWDRQLILERKLKTPERINLHSASAN